MPKSTCSIEGCDKRHKGRGYCDMHLSRFKIHGDPRKGAKPQKGVRSCGIEGCELPFLAKDLCRKHYSRLYRNNSPHDEDQAYVWDSFSECVFCGGPIPDGCKFRRYCRQACASSASMGASRPDNRPCAKCGELIDFTIRNESGRLRSSKTLLCRQCFPPAHLRRHVPALIARDGGDCGLCGESIDLSLKFPHPMSRSVDHILPRSLGGPDELSNYQLAHLGCNSAKKNRVEVLDAVT